MLPDALCPSHSTLSARLSSDGTLSEDATSDDTRTAMTSIADTDDDLDVGLHPVGGTRAGRDDHDGAGDAADPIDYSEPDDDELNDYHDLDTSSVYPLSYFPPSSPRGTTMQLYPGDLGAEHADQEYYMPNDEIEQLRLSLQHQVFLHMLRGDMTCVPLDHPKYILDVGTGTGESPIRMAELFPDCEVVGTDISAIAETRCVPMNVFFEIEDAEEWDRPRNLYDLIHFSCMEGAFRNWRFIYDSVFDSLKPGGWIELIDFDNLESIKIWFTAFSEGSPIFYMAKDLEIAAEKVGRRRGITHMDPQLLAESGFVDVHVTKHSMPMLVGEKSAGKLWLISCLDALEANCLRLLTQQMGWDPEKCKLACEQAARELADLAKDPEKAKGLVVKAWNVAAMKPLDARSAAPSTSVPLRSSSLERAECHQVPPVAVAATEPVTSPSG